VAGSRCQAGPPKIDGQLFGGPPSRPSRQTNQSRFALLRAARDSRNQGCWSELWFGTQSTVTLIPRAWASASSRSKSASVPNSGSTPQ